MGAGLSPEQNKIIADIRQYITDAGAIRLQPSRYDRDRRNFYALSMVLFALANRLIDLGREAVYSRGYAGPDEELKNKVVFRRLADHRIIDPATRQDLLRMVDFRNRCSHHFHELTKEELMEISDALPRYEVFVADMTRELERTAPVTKRQLILAAGIVLLLCLGLLYLFIS